MEFMSTVEVHESEGRHPTHESMNFRRDSEDRHVTLEELTNISHVPGGGLTQDASKSATNNFWDCIIDDEVRGYNDVRNKVLELYTEK